MFQGRQHHLTEREALTELGRFVGDIDAERKRTADERRKVAEEFAAKWTVEKRKQALKDGDALPGDPPKFPIKDQEDMNSAHTLKGSSNVPNATVEAHMKKQAKKHGLKLPPGLKAA